MVWTYIILATLLVVLFVVSFAWYHLYRCLKVIAKNQMVSYEDTFYMLKKIKKEIEKE